MLRPLLASAAAVLLCGSLAACGDHAVATSSPPVTTLRPAPAAVPRTARSLVAMPVPITIQPPPGLPLIETAPGLTTWRATATSEDAIRIMTPRFVLSADGTERVVPADFHAFLVGLVAQGVRITDDRAVTVDGVRGREFTITSTRTLGAALGCWEPAPEGCFGLPPELTMRMVTVEVAGRPVLLWARTKTAHPSTAIVAEFETMLRTVRFTR